VSTELHTILDLQIDAYVDTITRFQAVRTDLQRHSKTAACEQWLDLNQATIAMLESHLSQLRKVRFSNHPFAPRAK
jgi:hypothetical protein